MIEKAIIGGLMVLLGVTLGICVTKTNQLSAGLFMMFLLALSGLLIILN